MELMNKCPFWKEQVSRTVNTKKCVLTPYQDRKSWKFLISGKYPAFLELVEILKQIGCMCREHDIQNLIFYDFQAFMISKVAVQRCFKDIAINIELIQNPTVEYNKPEDKTEYSGRIKQKYAVNKIRLSSTVKGDAKEDIPRNQVSIMTKNKSIRKSLDN